MSKMSQNSKLPSAMNQKPPQRPITSAPTQKPANARTPTGGVRPTTSAPMQKPAMLGPNNNNAKANGPSFSLKTQGVAPSLGNKGITKSQLENKIKKKGLDKNVDFD